MPDEDIITTWSSSPNTSESTWLKESIYNGRSVKLEFEVWGVQWRYFKRPGKKIIKEICSNAA